MVGELNDIENSRDEGKQTKTSSTRWMKKEKSRLGKFWLDVPLVNSKSESLSERNILDHYELNQILKATQCSKVLELKTHKKRFFGATAATNVTHYVMNQRTGNSPILPFST